MFAGEFTLRAFLNGRLDLAQAESVAQVVAAKTSAAAETALAGIQVVCLPLKTNRTISSPLLAISRPLSRAQLHMLLLLCMIHFLS